MTRAPATNLLNFTPAPGAGDNNMGTIYVLWLRQLKRYWRSKARIIGSIGQPLLFLVALGLGFGPIYEKAGGGNYIQFLAPGVVAMAVVFSAMFFGMEVIWDRQFGFLKETLVAPVSRADIMIGRTLGGATVASAQGLIVLIISLIAGFRPESLLAVFLSVLFMFIIAVLFTALGTAIASQMEDMHAFPLIMNFLVMPMFFLSGSIFPLNNLPGAIQTIAAMNPLAYGVDLLRYALSAQTHYSLGLNLTVIIGADILLLAVGSYLFSKVEV